MITDHVSFTAIALSWSLSRIVRRLVRSSLRVLSLRFDGLRSVRVLHFGAIEAKYFRFGVAAFLDNLDLLDIEFVVSILIVFG